MTKKDGIKWDFSRIPSAAALWGLTLKPSEKISSLDPLEAGTELPPEALVAPQKAVEVSLETPVAR